MCPRESCTGLLSTHQCRVKGARWVGISGRAQKRCELALLHGATSSFNVADVGVDVAREIIQKTGGRGVDLVFDCGGSQDTIDTALASVRSGGTIVNVAVWKDTPTIDMNRMMYKEVVLTRKCRLSHLLRMSDVVWWRQTASHMQETIKSCFNRLQRATSPI